MVELRLESIQDVNVPKDCFVSVRVGDVQKLSRLGGSKTYKFPKINDKNRFGKIEVFRRIGAASINLDPDVKATREVSINCTDATCGSLGLRIGLEEGGLPKVAAEETPKSKGTAGKVKAAKEYLNHHSLEVRLSEAMQAVLRERPDDPVGFLAAALQSGVSPTGAAFKLPAVGGASPAAQGSPMAKPGSRGRNMASPTPPPGPKPAGQPQRLPALQQKASVPGAAPQEFKQVLAVQQAPPQNILPFGKYFATNFSLGAPGLQKVYSMFPAAPKATAARTSAPKPVAVSLSNFSVYYRETFTQSIGDMGIPGLYRNFPAFSAAAAKAAPAQSVVSKVNSFRMKPSVGTWIMKKPCPVKVDHPADKAATFQKLPSVGTWLAARLGEPQAPLAPAAAVAKAAPAAAQASFKLSPSVGTWLAPRPKPLALALPKQAEPMPRKNVAVIPSAATWIAPRPAILKRPKVDIVRRLQGLQAGPSMSLDERCEVERVLSKALLELTGDLEGEYYPLASSNSFVMRPGGMSTEEELMLTSKCLMFTNKPADASGRGVFTNAAGSVAVWVNENDSVPARFMVFQTGAEGAAMLTHLQNAVAGALKQDGYDWA